jgi:surfeit locus 1 family protein
MLRSSLIIFNISLTRPHPAVCLYSSEAYHKPPPISLKKVRINKAHESSKKKDESGEGSRGHQDSLGPKSNKFMALAFLGIPLITFGLGVWQVKRRQWKLEMIEYMEKRTQTEPIELPTKHEELRDLVKNNEYKPFKVKGHFLHSKEVILNIRHDLKGRVPLPGGYVITPFVVANRLDNLVILVNRGYVPYTKYLPSSRAEGQVNGEVELIGLLRDNEPTSTFTPVNKPPNEWHFRDIQLLASELNTAPIFIDAVDSTTVKGGPLGGQTQVNLRNEHMSYIITWFTLSALTCGLWWRRFARVFF